MKINVEFDNTEEVIEFARKVLKLKAQVDGGQAVSMEELNGTGILAHCMKEEDKKVVSSAHKEEVPQEITRNMIISAFSLLLKSGFHKEANEICRRYGIKKASELNSKYYKDVYEEICKIAA